MYHGLLSLQVNHPQIIQRGAVAYKRKPWPYEALRYNKAGEAAFNEIELLATEAQSLIRERDLLGAITLLATIRAMAKDGEVLMIRSRLGEYE